MRIKEYRSIGGRDFHATMECEHCGGTQELKTGYDDAYYHQYVIPAMTCEACGKNRAGEIPPEPNAHGMKHVEARLAEVERERDKARDELDGIAEVLDAAGVPQVTDGPDGRRWTLGPGARVEHVIAERDEARAEVEELRTRTAAQLEIETRARDEARADAARLRAQSEQRRAALERLNNIYRSEHEEPGPNPPWLAAALAGEGEGASDASDA